MAAVVDIEAGVCGFRTKAWARSEDGQWVSYEVTSDCEKIQALAGRLEAAGPIDAYDAIARGADSQLLTVCRDSLQGCCAGCVMPVGLFKAMQVAAGLALPRDIAVRLEKE